MKMTAAIYARVSSTRQKEEGTIASQTAALRDYAAAEELEVPADWVFEDEGYSGATLIRPELERLRDLAAEIEIPIVLCYAVDRLARRYAYQALLIEEFARVGTELRLIKNRKAETPEDELLLQFQGMIAEYERAQIAERTRRGKLHRARSGSAAVLSGAPYGYRYVRKTEETEARYELVEREATVVREMFRRYVEENEAIAGLGRWLGEQNIPTATGKSRWDRSTIWGMLRNPAYCGRAAFGKTRTSDKRAKMTRPVRRRGKRMPVTGRITREQPRSEWIEIPVPPIVSEQVFELGLVGCTIISDSLPVVRRNPLSSRASWHVRVVATAITERRPARVNESCTTTGVSAPTTTATSTVACAPAAPFDRIISTSSSGGTF